MKRTVPLLITAIAGFVLIVSFFLPAIQEWGEVAAIWFDVLAAIAFILGGGNLLKLHLKTMSDKKPGWAYSGVTIVAFLATLTFGLFKLGSPPASNSEKYGETFTPFPLSEMPVYEVDGVLPARGDDSPLPASVRNQLREEDGQIVFAGWMTKDQKQDLIEYKKTLDWRFIVEQLFDASQPESLDGKVKYYEPHRVLAVDGVLTDELRSALTEILPETETASQAVEGLAERSNRKTSVSVDAPETLAIPEDMADRLQLESGELSITGPMSIKIRDQLSRDWAGFPPAMPLSPQAIDELKLELESLGNLLNEHQAEVFQRLLSVRVGAEAMIPAINSAGLVPAQEKTAEELIAERDAGVVDLEPFKDPPEPVILNSEQEQAVEDFFVLQDSTVDELKQTLASLGDLTDAQQDAIDQFMNSLPREGERLHHLGIELLKAGPLSGGQQEFLFAQINEIQDWKQSVGRLFVAAHQVKYPWSGAYSAEGNPFWWVYEYVFQPLMTTTFAMLAFYVASAAFRAFRAKNIEAVLLLATAFIVLLGRTFAGVLLTDWIPDEYSALKIDQMTVYIMKIFNTAGNRAIMIGIALGIASTSLKVLLGIDRSYLGSGDD